MANTKEKTDLIISDKLVYIYLLLFPLGQLLRIETKLLGLAVTIHPTDLIALTLLLLILASRQKFPKVITHLYPFIAISIFSLVMSLSMFSLPDVIRGSLFLLRLLSYVALFVAAYNMSLNAKKRQMLLKSLITSLLFVAIFGWVQYLFLPDLRWLRSLGWDDHLYRLTSTLLDPGYTGLILLFGLLLSIGQLVRTQNKLYILSTALFLLSVAFTYSRASYLSLLAGIMVFVVSVNKRVKRMFIILIIAFVVLIPLLPRPSSSGAQLERIYSIGNRIDYYKETFQVWEKFPVFGVGFNNLCAARQKFVQKDSYSSHSCSGSDSGILFVLATTGIIGIFTLTTFVFKVSKKLPRSIQGTTFCACAVALFTHSFFTNSIFYPWVLGFMAMLLAVTLTKEGS